MKDYLSILSTVVGIASVCLSFREELGSSQQVLLVSLSAAMIAFVFYRASRIRSAKAPTTLLTADGRPISAGTKQRPRGQRFLRPWALAVTLVVCSGVVVAGYMASASRHAFHAVPAKKHPRVAYRPGALILVARLDGPSPSQYRITETVYRETQAAVLKYSDIRVEFLDRRITEADGSRVARQIGEERRAAVVVWGWYGNTGECIPLCLNYEIMDLSQWEMRDGLQSSGQVQVHTSDYRRLHDRVSSQVAFLSLYMAGVTRYAVGNARGAIECLNDCISRDSKWVDTDDRASVYSWRGGCYAQQRAYAKALTDYDTAIRICPVDPSFYTGRADIHMVMSNWKQAADDIHSALSLKPSYGPAYLLRGRLRIAKGQYAIGLPDLDKALSLEGQSCVAYVRHGMSCATAGDERRALADMNRALGLKPENPRGYFERGMLCCALKEYDQALADLDTACRMGFRPAELYGSRGLTYLCIGDYGKAAADLGVAIRTDPSSKEWYGYRAQAYARLGDIDKALADLDRAIELQPKSAGNYVGRGLMRLECGDTNRALSDFDMAIAIDPGEAVAYYGKGKACYQAGRYDQSISALKRFTEFASEADADMVQEADRLMAAAQEAQDHGWAQGLQYGPRQ